MAVLLLRPNCHVEYLFKLIDKMADLLLKSAKIIWVDLGVPDCFGEFLLQIELS